MSTSDSCNNNQSDISSMLQNLSTADISVCANCGKEGNSDEIKNICNKCKKVKYCNAVCKKKHRSKHKKECEGHIRLAAEHAAKLHDIELFKQPSPPEDDCPICFLLIPKLGTGSSYYACCGKRVCNGCAHAPVYDNQGNVVAEKICPFCRTPVPKSEEEMIERYEKRMEAIDVIAIYAMGCYYREGLHGYPQDVGKGLELLHRAAELGYPLAYSCIGNMYEIGRGVEVDKKKARHYYELAAIGGCEKARYNLGSNEKSSSSMGRALKHYMIAVRSGQNNSLSAIKRLYSNGHASKDDYMEAIQAYQKYLGEIKSPQRDKAAAAHVRYRYY